MWTGQRNSPALIERVIALWNAGASAGMIAEQLRRTRNQIMGILHRARVQDEALVKRRSASPSEAKPRERKPAASRIKQISRFRFSSMVVKPRAAVVALQAQPSAALPFVDLALPSGRTMRWHVVQGCAFLLSDDVTDPAWCNAPVVPGRAWCPYHFALTHTRLPPRGGG